MRAHAQEEGRVNDDDYPDDSELESRYNNMYEQRMNPFLEVRPRRPIISTIRLFITLVIEMHYDVTV